MRDMVDRMGVVHLGPMLQVLAGRLSEFQRYLRVPRSLVCWCLFPSVFIITFIPHSKVQ